MENQQCSPTAMSGEVVRQQDYSVFSALSTSSPSPTDDPSHGLGAVARELLERRKRKERRWNSLGARRG